jgi:Mitochondrial carrier protein
VNVLCAVHGWMMRVGAVYVVHVCKPVYRWSTYQTLKPWLFSNFDIPSSLTYPVQGCAGVLAGCTSAVVTNPLDVIRTQLQVCLEFSSCWTSRSVLLLLSMSSIPGPQLQSRVVLVLFLFLMCCFALLWFSLSLSLSLSFLLPMFFRLADLGSS